MDKEEELFKIGYERVQLYNYIIEYRRGKEHLCFDTRTKEIYKYEDSQISDTFIYSKISLEEVEIIESIIKELDWRKTNE